MVELDHSFDTGKDTDYNWDAIRDLDRLIPCVEGGSVTERDDDAGRAVLKINSKDVGGSGYANADVAFTLTDGGGTIHTAAQISGKAASMGEGVVSTVLDALIKDFTQKLAAI